MKPSAWTTCLSTTRTRLPIRPKAADVQSLRESNSNNRLPRTLHVKCLRLKRTTRRNSDGSGPDESDDESGPSSSQRRSLRSASVTPLKGIQSTRSATRAVAALRLGKKGREQRESSLLAQRRIAATPTSVTDEEADEEMDEDEEEQDEQPQPQKKPAGTRDQALDESDASESDSNPPEKKPKVEDESSDEPGPSSSKDKDKKNTAKRQSKPSADIREQSSAGTDKEVV